MPIRKYLAFIVIAFINSRVTAQTIKQEWRLSELIEATLSSHPDMDLARERLEESESSRSQAYTELFPKINSSLSANTKRDFLSPNAASGGEPYSVYAVGLELSQPIYVGGAVSASVASYAAEKRARQFDLQLSERDLSLQTLLAYYKVLLADRQLATMKQLESIQSELLRTAQKRYRIGNEQALSVLQIKTNLSLIVPQVSAAQNTLSVRVAELASLVGKPEIRVHKIKGSLESPDWLAVQKKAPAKSVERAELERALTMSEQLVAQKKVKMAIHYPNVSALASWGRSGNQKSDLFDQDSNAWSLGLKLSIPLFSGLSSRHDSRILESKIAQSRIAVRRQQYQLSLDQVRAEQEMANAKEQVNSSHKALSQAKEAVALATRTYRLGTATYLQVSEAQQKLANAELAYEQSQFELVTNMARYFVAFAWPLRTLIEELEKHWEPSLK